MDDHAINQFHYTNHEFLDDKHAKDLFFIASDTLHSNEDILEALVSSKADFMNLYENLGSSSE